ncbi:hypothetical protein OAK91_02895 [Planctomycetaceae bacterium]|nr:hypothetical protein [Planctomycetaceae bacterium]
MNHTMHPRAYADLIADWPHLVKPSPTALAQMGRGPQPYDQTTFDRLIETFKAHPELCAVILEADHAK